MRLAYLYRRRYAGRHLDWFDSICFVANRWRIESWNQQRHSACGNGLRGGERMLKNAGTTRNRRWHEEENARAHANCSIVIVREKGCCHCYVHGRLEIARSH